MAAATNSTAITRPSPRLRDNRAQRRSMRFCSYLLGWVGDDNLPLDIVQAMASAEVCLRLDPNFAPARAADVSIDRLAAIRLLEQLAAGAVVPVLWRRLIPDQVRLDLGGSFLRHDRRKSYAAHESDRAVQKAATRNG